MGPGAIQLSLRMLGLGTSIVVVAVLARYLGPQEYGALTAGLTIAALLCGLIDSGIFSIGVRRIVLGSSAREVSRDMVIARLLMLGLTFPVALALILLFGGDAASVMVIAATGALPYAFIAYRACAEAAGRPVLVGITVASQNIAWLVFALLAVGGGLSVEQLAGLSVLAVVVQALVAFIFAVRLGDTRIRKEVNFRGAMNLIREAGPLIASSLAVSLYYRGSQLVVFAVSEPEVGASYLASMRLLDAAQILPATIISVYFPVLVAKTTRTAGAASSLNSVFIRTLAVTSAVAIVVALAAPIISILLLGENYPSASSILSILFFAFPFISGGYIATSALVARGSRKLASKISSTTAAIGLITIVILSINFGAHVAAVGVVLVEAVHCVALSSCYYRVSSRKVDE